MKTITTLTGPSCAGKSTLENMLVERGFQKAVSTTTRAPRAGEVDGEHYYFISQEKFATMRELNMFVEAVQFGEHWYGLSTPELERLFQNGDNVVIVCEPVGAKQIRKYCENRSDIRLRQVFVNNPRSVINDRFLRRFFGDARRVAALECREYSDKFFAAYAERMTIMQEVESKWQDEWAIYDTVLSRFDEANAVETADALAVLIPA